MPTVNVSEEGGNENFLFLIFFWVKQKRQNKDVLASKRKAAGKPTTLWLKWRRSDIINSSAEISKLEFNKKYSQTPS